MKVLLVKDISGLGRAGDIKEVSDGYARNFLMPKHLALPASERTLEKAQKEQAEKIEKVKHLKEKSEALKYKLESKTFTIKAKAQTKTLFAGVKATEVAEAVNEKAGVDISADQVTLPIIKTLGMHEATLDLGEKVKAKIKLNVVPITHNGKK
ncbi:MAG TPA: 50S ribosomal protein L9 [Patescibacteria group bacterium]|jgi:large subunit ribosomal protein L9|nr:50S ribosomal protein L9 [Patescibacteria group bacterium]